MSRVTTLTNIRQQEDISVQTLVLRDRSVEDASVQTSLSGMPINSNLNESLREIARTRLERGESNLPLRPNLDGRPISDSEDFRNLNEILDEETRLDILNSIANDNYRGDLIRVILANLSDETLTRLNNTIQSPVSDLETYTPLLNILMYGNVGLNDFNVAITNLANLITDMQAPMEPQHLDVSATIENIEARTEATNQDINRDAQEADVRRSNILSSLN